MRTFAQLRASPARATSVDVLASGGSGRSGSGYAYAMSERPYVAPGTLVVYTDIECARSTIPSLSRSCETA
jgi:hypothetical protein